MRMRAAGQNPLLAAQRGINLHAVYALAWSLSTLTGALAGILMALDSGITTGMPVIALKAFPGGAGRRARQPCRRAARRADHRRGGSAADLLRRSAVVRRGAVPGADCHADRAALGPVRHARGARPCLGRRRAPAAISAPTTPRTSRWCRRAPSAQALSSSPCCLPSFPLLLRLSRSISPARFSSPRSARCR